jgi:hypothetical protein
MLIKTNLFSQSVIKGELWSVLDMRQVVESVPSIEGQNRTQWVVFIPSGVEVLSFELFGVKAFDQSSPAVVYAFKNL